jgi:TolA-binding protein
MESLLSYVPFIAAIVCPVGMALMMWYMGRSNGQGMCGMNMTPPTQPAADKDAQITVLQEQLQTMQERVRTLEASAPPVEKQSAHIKRL